MKSVLREGMPTQGTFESTTCHSDRPYMKVKGHDHKLYTDNLLSSSDLDDDDVIKKKINCCVTTRPNTKGVPQDLGTKKIKLK
jgi:hypothetical protein